MRILIINSCNSSGDPHKYVFVKEQADALRAIGLTIEHYCIIGKGIIGYLKNLNSLIRKVSIFKPDIIHAHYGLSGLLANFQRKVPVVTTYHGSDINNSKAFLFSRLSIIMSAHNIFVSEDIRKKSILKSKNSLIPCGVDTKLFSPIDRKSARSTLGIKNDKKVILFAGSFSRKVKNAALAKAAISLMSNIELIELKGFRREQVAKLINASDALLMTSFSEGSPQIIKEAMACNCPIVSVPVGDVPEMIENLEGYHISSYNATDIAIKLQKSLDFKGKIAGRERIMEKGLDNITIANRLKGLFESILREE